MCFIFWIFFLALVNFSKSQLLIIDEKNFLADLVLKRKILNDPPQIETIQDKDEKIIFLQLPQEEEDEQKTNDDRSTSKIIGDCFSWEGKFFPRLLFSQGTISPIFLTHNILAQIFFLI